MAKYSLIRTIYLYSFALLGLVLLTIGAIRFLDMGLKAFVFTKAEEEQRLFQKQPPFLPMRVDKIAEEENGELKPKEGEITLTEAEKTTIDQWITDYNAWQERVEKVDPVTSRRHRDASMNLALILVGLPLYLYHWTVIKKEVENKA